MSRAALAMLLGAALGLAGCRADTNLYNDAGDLIEADSGPLNASLQVLNGGLTLPGVEVVVTPNVVATSPKVFVRQDTSDPPNCLYGVYAADPRFLPGGPDGEELNNGLLLVAYANNNILNNDPNLGGESRTTCPDSTTYVYGDGGVGGNIPDGVKIGDTLQVAGQLTPYCDSYDKQAASCSTPIFPEFAVNTLSDLHSGSAPSPVAVSATLIEDGADSAIGYAGMLVQVGGVTLVQPFADSNGSIVVQQNGTDAGFVGAGLWVSPLTTTVTLPQTVGQGFSQITGELHFITGHWRLQPRTASDVVTSN